MIEEDAIPGGAASFKKESPTEDSECQSASGLGVRGGASAWPSEEQVMERAIKTTAGKSTKAPDSVEERAGRFEQGLDVNQLHAKAEAAIAEAPDPHEILAHLEQAKETIEDLEMSVKRLTPKGDAFDVIMELMSIMRPRGFALGRDVAYRLGELAGRLNASMPRETITEPRPGDPNYVGVGNPGDAPRDSAGQPL